MHIIQVGGYPPPLGGTSIHNQRLHALLLREGIDARHIDPYGQHGSDDLPPTVITLRGPWPLRLLRLWNILRAAPRAIVHFQVSAFGKLAWVGLPLLWAATGHITLLSIQSGSFAAEYHSGSALRRWLTRRILHGVDRINVMNVEQRDLLAAGFALDPDRLSVIPIFIPPRPAPDDALPDGVLDAFHRLRARSECLIIAAGSLTPIYALDVALDAFRQAQAASNAQLGIVLGVYALYRTDPVIQARVDDLRDDAVLLCEELDGAQFYRLVQEADIFLRPTTTDGDSSALREALFAGLQCIASDAVPRPPGVLLFPTGDAAALSAALLRCVADDTPGKAASPISDNGPRYLELYRQLWDAEH